MKKKQNSSNAQNANLLGGNIDKKSVILESHDNPYKSKKDWLKMNEKHYEIKFNKDSLGIPIKLCFNNKIEDTSGRYNVIFSKDTEEYFFYRTERRKFPNKPTQIKTEKEPSIIVSITKSNQIKVKNKNGLELTIEEIDKETARQLRDNHIFNSTLIC